MDYTPYIRGVTDTAAPKICDYSFTSEDYLDDSSETIRNLVDSCCILPENIPELPVDDKLKVDAYLAFWDKAQKNPNTALLNSLSEINPSFFLQGPGNYKRVYEKLDNLGVSNNKTLSGYANYSMAQVLDVPHNNADFTPAHGTDFFYKRSWDTLKDGGDNATLDLAVFSAIEYLTMSDKKGLNDNAVAKELEQIDISRIPLTSRARWHYALAVSYLNDNDNVSYKKHIESALKLVPFGNAMLLYYLGKFQEGFSIEAGIKLIKENVQLIKSDNSDIDRLQMENQAIIKCLVIFGVRDKPFDKAYWKNLDGLFKCSVDGVDVLTERAFVTQWMEYLRTDNLDIAKAALSIVFGEPANTLGSFERALKYDIMLGLARLTKATQGPGLSIFIESFLLDPSGSVTKVYAVEAARLTAFHLTVTRDNLELAFRLFDNAVKMAQEIDESKIPEELKGRYHLYCGSAWSQWAEFSVDHGDALIVMGIIDSYNTIVDNIYRGMTTADGHLSDAIKLLPDDAEARLKYIWNRYYFAKYKDVFEDTINESKSIVEEVSTLRHRGLASPAQYFSAVRCHGWAVTEWANTLASSSPDEVRKPLSELMGILKTVDPKELERKEKIDLYWLTFKTNYVMGKTYPHPTRAIELWMKDREEKDAKAPAMEPLSKEARQYFDNADKALGNVAIAGETDGELMRMLAWLRLRQGRITEALDAFEQALKLGVKHHDDTLNGEMLAYLEQFITEAAKPLAVRLKTLDTAVAVIERRIELGDDWTLSRNTELLQDLAKICTIFSEYGQASESAKRIIKKVENPSLRGSELVSEIQKGCHISNQ